jgi:hypothetical protein
VEFTWIGICAAVMVLAFVGLPIAAVSQRRLEKPAGSKLARLNAWLVSVAFLAGAVGMAIGLQDPNEIVFGLPAGVAVAGRLWAVELVLAISLIAFTVTAWRRKWWRMAGRICLTLVCAAALGSAAWLYHWNLLG